MLSQKEFYTLMLGSICGVINDKSLNSLFILIEFPEQTLLSCLGH
jgi:hypothetical protein